MVLAKEPMSRSKGHRALWKTPSENTDHGMTYTCTVLIIGGVFHFRGSLVLIYMYMYMYMDM